MQDMREINTTMAAIIRDQKHYDQTLYAVSAIQLLTIAKIQARSVGKVKTGSYNSADPTAFEQIECHVLFEMDPYFLRDWKHTPAADDDTPPEQYQHAPPPASLYKMRMDDCTWGTEVTLDIVDSEIEDHEFELATVERGNRAVSFYIDHHSGLVTNRSTVEGWDAYDLLMRLLLGEGTMMLKPHVFDKNLSESEIHARLAMEADLHRAY